MHVKIRMSREKNQHFLICLSISPYIAGFFELLFTPVVIYLPEIFCPKGFWLPVYSSVDYAKLRPRHLPVLILCLQWIQTQDMDPDALIQPHSNLKLENYITCNLRALSSSLAASRRSSMSISTSGISSSWKAKTPT